MKRANRSERLVRDEAIRVGYVEGASLQDMARRHNVTQERVRQIVIAAGLYKPTPRARLQHLGG